MNERIKKARKALDLTQREFAARIGMKQNSIALIESGRNTSDQTIFAICREFNVNETWLRTGEGEMFTPAPSSELDALAEKYGLSGNARILVERFLSLKKPEQDAIINFIRETAASMSGVQTPSFKSGVDIDDMSDEEFGRFVREHMKVEEKAREKSEA